MKNLTISILLIIFSVSISFCQEIPKSDIKIIINGEKYYQHTVEAKQTLFSISKTYDVDSEIIKQHNQGMTNDLSIGQVVNIPIIENHENEVIRDEEKYIYHKVRRKETVYSLTKEYNVSEETFFALNPNVKENGLKKGEEVIFIRPIQEEENITNVETDTIKKEESSAILIPRDTIKYIYHTIKEKETAYSISKLYSIEILTLEELNPDKDFNSLSINDSIIVKVIHYDFETFTNNNTDPLKLINDSILPDTLYVALLLPFSVQKNNWRLKSQAKRKVEIKLQSFYENLLHFYSGILTSLNTNVQNNIYYNLQVFDTYNDSIFISEFITNSKINNVDIIIGPVFPQNIKIVEQNINKEKTILINPFVDINFSNKSLKKIALKANPKNYLKFMSDTLCNIDSANIIVVYKDSTDNNQIDTYNYLIKNNKNFTNTIDKFQFTLTNFNISKVSKIMKKDIENIFVIGDINEVEFAKLINSLNQIENYNLRLVGTKKHFEYDNIQTNFYINTNYTYLTSYDINFKDSTLNTTIKYYREEFKTEPNIYSFIGMDIANNLVEFYNFFSEENLDKENIEIDGLCNKYIFKREENYFGNSNLHIRSVKIRKESDAK